MCYRPGVDFQSERGRTTLLWPSSTLTAYKSELPSSPLGEKKEGLDG